MKSFSLANATKAAFTIALPLLVSLGLPGCYKDPDFSTTPAIAFKGIQKFTTTDLLGNPNVDSVVISIHFQDGDGDLGLTQEEVNIVPWKDKFNYEVKSFVKREAQYVPMTNIFGVEVNDSGNFFPLNPSEKAGPIEGTLDYSIKYNRVSAAKDTVRFEVRIYDKALHVSSWITTDPIVVNSQTL